MEDPDDAAPLDLAKPCYVASIPVLISLFYIGLFLQLAGPPPLARPGSEVDLRRQEVRLLHLGLDRAALRTLLVWEPKTDALRDARPGEVVDDSTPVMILHLWATWCDPCKEEFPLWQKLGPRLAEQHSGKVRIAHVALQNDSSDMAGFVQQMHGRLPFPVRHFDRKERLAGSLRKALTGKQLTLPMTLLLDRERVVRQAIIGPISERRQELAESTARLVQLIQQQDDAASHPRSAPANGDDTWSQ